MARHVMRPLLLFFRNCGRVLKLPRCLPMALTAAFGSLYNRPSLDMHLGWMVVGILLLACGCGGINSVQEADVDSLLQRTCDRPLATGQMSKRLAVLMSSLLIVGGLATLFVNESGWIPPLLGLGAVLLYNGLYTPLKQISVFALLPGGLAGGLPPLIGWTSAGGEIDDLRAWIIFSLFFLWQIPHYCLIVLQYREEYSDGPFPSLIRLFPEATLRKIILVWAGAFALVLLTLTLDRTLLPFSRLVLAAAALLVPIVLAAGLQFRRPSPYRLLLRVFNGVFFLTLSVVAALQLMLVG